MSKTTLYWLGGLGICFYVWRYTDFLRTTRAVTAGQTVDVPGLGRGVAL